MGISKPADESTAAVFCPAVVRMYCCIKVEVRALQASNVEEANRHNRFTVRKYPTLVDIFHVIVARGHGHVL